MDLQVAGRNMQGVRLIVIRVQQMHEGSESPANIHPCWSRVSSGVPCWLLETTLALPWSRFRTVSMSTCWHVRPHTLLVAHEFVNNGSIGTSTGVIGLACAATCWTPCCKLSAQLSSIPFRVMAAWPVTGQWLGGDVGHPFKVSIRVLFRSCAVPRRRDAPLPIDLVKCASANGPTSTRTILYSKSGSTTVVPGGWETSLESLLCLLLLVLGLLAAPGFISILFADG